MAWGVTLVLSYTNKQYWRITVSVMYMDLDSIYIGTTVITLLIPLWPRYAVFRQPLGQSLERTQGFRPSSLGGNYECWVSCQVWGLRSRIKD